MNTTNTILITGGRGMIGKNMSEVLVENGYTNILEPSSSELNYKNQAEVNTYFAKHQPQVVIHAAAKVGGIQANIDSPAVFFHDNIQIAVNLFEAAYTHKVKKLINIGSSCMYPRECVQPMHEHSLLTGAPEPTNEGYAIAKIVTTKYCQFFYQQYGCNFYTLVAPNMYGPYEQFDLQHSHVVSALMMKFHAAKQNGDNTIELWGDGSARREFLYAADFTSAVIHFMRNVDAKDIPDTYLNIGWGTDISIKELATLIANIIGFNGQILWDTTKPNGMPQKVMDVRKMQTYNWQPTTSLETGMMHLYKFYLKQICR